MQKLLGAIALPAIAVTAALLTGMTAANAWDRQATSAEMDNELNYGAVTRGYGLDHRGPYGYSDWHRSRR